MLKDRWVFDDNNKLQDDKKGIPAMTMMGLRRMLERTKMWMSSRESNWRPLLLETGDAIFTIFSHSSSQFWNNKHTFTHTEKVRENIFIFVGRLHKTHNQGLKFWVFSFSSGFCHLAIMLVQSNGKGFWHWPSLILIPWLCIGVRSGWTPETGAALPGSEP